MQRTGRRGHAQFRVIVQDSRAHPKNGRVVAYLGSYDPHTKAASIDNDKISQYLKNGAQPSERMVKLLKKEGLKVPKWAASETKKKRSVKNPDKLRRNRPAGEVELPKPADKDEAGPVVENEVAGEDQTAETTPATPEDTQESAPDEAAPPQPANGEVVSPPAKDQSDT